MRGIGFQVQAALFHTRRSFVRIIPYDPWSSLFSHRFHTGGNSDNKSGDTFESADDFEQRLFGGLDETPNTDSFYKKLDKLEKAHGRSNISSKKNDGDSSGIMDGLGEGFDTLSDGMDEKLKKAARTFVYSDEVLEDDYSFRPDMTFRPGTTYTLRDLNLRKPGIQKPFNRPGFETNTKEVLQKECKVPCKLLDGSRDYHQMKPYQNQRESSEEGRKGDQDRWSRWAHALHHYGHEALHVWKEHERRRR